jgi:hypothetical protein
MSNTMTVEVIDFNKSTLVAVTKAGCVFVDFNGVKVLVSRRIYNKVLRSSHKTVIGAIVSSQMPSGQNIMMLHVLSPWG